MAALVWHIAQRGRSLPEQRRETPSPFLSVEVSRRAVRCSKGLHIDATHYYFISQKHDSPISAPPVSAFMSKNAKNYNIKATQDDGSCKYQSETQQKHPKKRILYNKENKEYLKNQNSNFYNKSGKSKINLVNLSRDPLFVPETKQINDLLDDFKNKKKNIAIAVDEWGGTSGLVTLEDVVEEIVGEVSDPYDKEEYSFREISDDKYIVEGAIKIYDLEENIEVKFPEVREYDTLAGYIFDAMGDIPKINEQVTFQDYSFKVVELTKNRIDKVEIKKNQ